MRRSRGVSGAGLDGLKDPDGGRLLQQTPDHGAKDRPPLIPVLDRVADNGAVFDAADCAEVGQPATPKSYSERIVVAGSTRAARIAGIQHAATPMATMITVTPTSVTGSFGDTS
jgi:hypothetical protein